jgi:hypothetical protein
LFATSGNEDHRHMHALGPPVRHRTRSCSEAKLLLPHARRFFSTSRLPKHINPSFTSSSAAFPLHSSIELVARGDFVFSSLSLIYPASHLRRLCNHLRTQQPLNMAAIQNFKNFLRHGKQARQNAEPTTNVSNVHAQSQQQRHHAPDPVHHGISEPIMAQKQQQHGNVPHGDYSVGAGAGDNRNVAAQAGAAADRAAQDKQKRQDAAQGKGVDPSVLERIVAEEREAKGKMPRYPGLERWNLIEKMGDGAFSNVYRATDSQGQWGEVAIKVVRKFEMNSQQVSITRALALNYPSLNVVIPPPASH